MEKECIVTNGENGEILFYYITAKVWWWWWQWIAPLLAVGTCTRQLGIDIRKKQNDIERE